MTFIQKISYFILKKINFLSLLDSRIFRIKRFNPFILITFLVIFSLIFFVTSNLIYKKNKENESNFQDITKTTTSCGSMPISLQNFSMPSSSNISGLSSGSSLYESNQALT